MTQPAAWTAQGAEPSRTPGSAPGHRSDGPWPGGVPSPRTEMVAPGPHDGGIATLPPLDDATVERSPINPSTGEPRRPPVIWISALLGYLATVIVAVAVSQVLWRSVESFAEASWINQTMDTDPGSWVRVAFSIINAVTAAVVGGASAFVAYHAFCGAGWTRWGGIAATGISLLSLLLTPLAAISIAPTAIAAGLLWLRPARRYFNAWDAQREWKVRTVALPASIRYGPVPRYGGPGFAAAQQPTAH